MIKEALEKIIERKLFEMKKIVSAKMDKDDPPFTPDKEKSTPWTSPASKAKHMARAEMKKRIKKTLKEGVVVKFDPSKKKDKPEKKGPIGAKGAYLLPQSDRFYKALAGPHKDSIKEEAAKPIIGKPTSTKPQPQPNPWSSVFQEDGLKKKVKKKIEEGKIKDLVTKDQEGSLSSDEKKKMDALKKANKLREKWKHRNPAKEGANAAKADDAFKPGDKHFSGLRKGH